MKKVIDLIKVIFLIAFVGGNELTEEDRKEMQISI